MARPTEGGLVKLIVALAAAALTAMLAAPAAMTEASARTPVIKYRDNVFGAILATRAKKALYYWNVEKRAGERSAAPGPARERGRL
jgi:hypothetical protein